IILNQSLYLTCTLFILGPDLLNGQLTTPDRYHDTLRQLKLDSDSAYRVLLIQAQSNGHALADYFSERPTISRQLIHLLKSHWPDLRYRIRSDHLTFIFRDQAPAQTDLKEALAQLPVEAKTIYYHAGVGTAQLPNRLKQSASEALKTIQLMERLVPHAALRTFTGLGFYRCLPTPDHPRDLQSLVPENLWSLNQRHPELYQTLVAYIQHNLSVKQGAAALFIHPKAMSYRLRKLRELLQTDFTDAEELFTFNVGIHVLRLLDQPVPAVPLDSL
ncbi:PucR family transcriptional regulator, partial [Levilactobacillus spicheri]